MPVINFDARLQAAKQLQAQLKLVLDGEPPYDIFVRWKSLSKQAIGWHPDVNDGVRLNIRPFMAEDIPGGKKGAGVLRTKPNIKWDKDRGKEPARDKSEFPWFWGWDEKTQNFAGIGKEPDGNLLTDHFGLVSDFLSECWDQLRRQSRQNVTQGRVHFGGALSGRDTTGVQKTISGLIKLVSPNPATPVADETLEWAVRIALECRRRVKEQQKRIGSAEFRNTQFSYSMGEDGVEKFVSTPELYSENSIGGDPLPPGQAWVISSGGTDENPSLYQVDVTEGPGSGVKILNQPAPPAFRESVRCAEQNLYVRAKELVGDRDPREHEFSVQLRAFDSAMPSESARFMSPS